MVSNNGESYVIQGKLDGSTPDIVPLAAYNFERDAWHNMLQVESDPLDLKSKIAIYLVTNITYFIIRNFL